MSNQTKLSDLINPEVMADIISAKVPQKLRVLPFAKIDTTLRGVPGDTITIPKYKYVGDAVDVAEGEAVEVSKLTADKQQATVKKSMKAITLTDEAVLSGYGNPAAEANNQLALAVASKIDTDCIDCLLKATDNVHDLSTTSVINYEGIVDAIDLFNEEVNTEKVIFVNPKQVTLLRKDPNFISADKYPGNTILTGEVGTICNARVVASNKIKEAEGTHYVNPIVKLNNDMESEDDLPALTVFLKRDVNLETERNTLKRHTVISVDSHYVAAVTNTSKVVLVKFKKSAK